MTAHVSMLLKSRASMICFRAYFLPGRTKDLSAPRYSITETLYILGHLVYSPRVISAFYSYEHTHILYYIGADRNSSLEVTSGLYVHSVQSDHVARLQQTNLPPNNELLSIERKKRCVYCRRISLSQTILSH